MFTPVLTIFTQSRFLCLLTCVAFHSHACGIRATFRCWRREAVEGPSKGMIPSWYYVVLCIITGGNQSSGLWLGHVYTQVSMTECRHETGDQGLAINTYMRDYSTARSEIGVLSI